MPRFRHFRRILPDKVFERDRVYLAEAALLRGFNNSCFQENPMTIPAIGLAERDGPSKA